MGLVLAAGTEVCRGRLPDDSVPVCRTGVSAIPWRPIGIWMSCSVFRHVVRHQPVPEGHGTESSEPLQDSFFPCGVIPRCRGIVHPLALRGGGRGPWTVRGVPPGSRFRIGRPMDSRAGIGCGIAGRSRLGCPPSLIAVSLSSRATAEMLPPDAASNSSTSVTLSTEALAARARPSLVTLTARGRDGFGRRCGHWICHRSLGFDRHQSARCRRSASGDGTSGFRRGTRDHRRPCLRPHLDPGRSLGWLHESPSLLLGTARYFLRGRGRGDGGTLSDWKNSVVAGCALRTPHARVRRDASGRHSDRARQLGRALMDRAGRVQGIVNAKSFLTRNLGFATPVNLLNRSWSIRIRCP